MKKHYVLFFLALIAAFIPAAADTYVVDIDDVSRVELDIDGIPSQVSKTGRTQSIWARRNIFA